MKKTIMRKYAKLAVQKGVNLQKGQGAVIQASVSEHEFAEMVAEEAYRAGAKWVRMEWTDQAVTRLHYRHQTVTELCFDDLDAPPVVVGARNWITPPYEFDHYFFPQASWILDAIHQQILPLPGYVPGQSCTETETVRKAKLGV